MQGRALLVRILHCLVSKFATLKVTNPDSEPFEVAVNQTFNDEQISWFRHGSALNFMKWQNARATRSNVA